MSAILKESVQKGFRPFKPTGIEKGKSFLRQSKGAKERANRRWGFRKVKNRIELVHV